LEQIENAIRYLKDVEWPPGLPVGYNVTRDFIVLYVKKLDWILLRDEDVVKAADTMNRTLTWLNSNGYPARLEAQ
jgi:hypothetical protein